MNEVNTRQYISIFLVFVFGILALASFIYTKKIDEQFETLCQMVVAFYLGKVASKGMIE